MKFNIRLCNGKNRLQQGLAVNSNPIGVGGYMKNKISLVEEWSINLIMEKIIFHA